MEIPKLLDYQKSHYKNIYNSIKKYSRALDASDTGTGKTYVSAKICKELGLIPFVICPKSVVSSWNNVLKQFGFSSKNYIVITYDQLALSDFVSNDSGEYTWNFESDDKFKGNEKKKYLFIYDEAHKCKNSNTINSKIMLNLSSYPVKILLLSATIIDKPLFFIPFGIVLGFYKTIPDGIEWMGRTINKKASNPLLPIHKLLFNEYASRMRIDDTVGIFKDNKILFEGIQMENYYEIEQKYDKINKILESNKKKSNKTNKSNKSNKKHDVDDDLEGFSESDDFDSDSDSGKKNKGLGKIQKIRQEIEFLRVDSIHKLTLKYLMDNKSVAIFVNFTDTIVELSKRLNTKCIIWGSQTLKERNKSINDFCSDKSRVIICNIQSGGVGVSLNDTIGNFPRVSIISPTWSAQDLIQVLGRIHRAMGKTDCVQHIIFCKGTIEESVGSVIKNKINNIRIFNDGNKQIKKDNMEVILNQEINKKQKKLDTDNYIYKTNDIDAIQDRLENLEKDMGKLRKELEKYKVGTNEHSECKFRLDKVNKELDFNLKSLDKMIQQNFS
jgi:superfamily II DNA or RNA helicase